MDQKKGVKKLHIVLMCLLVAAAIAISVVLIAVTTSTMRTRTEARLEVHAANVQAAADGYVQLSQTLYDDHVERREARIERHTARVDAVAEDAAVITDFDAPEGETAPSEETPEEAQGSWWSWLKNHMRNANDRLEGYIQKANERFQSAFSL